ncbi:hypothetical protein AOQ72_10325 [Bradyrhizobium yuanmingense]|uniref:Uncharacterized protein n=1 Tax=Bradyrhizobium yuanmingense TaxID=108015 RepID=A0A0R3CW26_9BRAD|nr:hypothetical protein AOQ72_10325 [Bradyrhizobium yuanmingense]
MTLIWAPALARVHMQDHSINFVPVRSLALGLQKANVRDYMLFVIGRQRWLIRRTVRYVWI